MWGLVCDASFSPIASLFLQVDGQVVALLVQNLERLDESVREEADGVHNTLGEEQALSWGVLFTSLFCKPQQPSAFCFSSSVLPNYPSRSEDPCVHFI